MAWSLGAGLEGKGVIVTGAAGGIGRKVAEAFATTGARVMAVNAATGNLIWVTQVDPFPTAMITSSPWDAPRY